MPLASLHAPFNHPDWIFELKYDGFRALAYIEAGACRLVSRKGTQYSSFPHLSESIAAVIPGQAVLDGEIVHLAADGRPMFYELMRRRTPQHYYAFDLLWLDGRDLRNLARQRGPLLMMSGGRQSTLGRRLKMPGRAGLSWMHALLLRRWMRGPV